MSTLLAADYAWQHPAPAAIRAAGYVDVIRYLSADPSKNLTIAEAASLHAAGLGIGLVYETTATRAVGGAIDGRADGQLAAAQLRGLGVPAGRLVMVNVGDFAATPVQIAAIHAYYAAFRSAAGPVQLGGYGTAFIIDQLVKDGAIGLWWQNAMDDSGESGSVVSPHASIYQRVKPTKVIAGAVGEYDEDVFGFGPVQPAWWQPAASPAPPAPKPAPVLQSVTVTARYSDGSIRSWAA